MKTTHYILLIILAAAFIGCDKITFPDENKEKTENNSGAEDEGVDDDPEDDDDGCPSDEKPGSGVYHGYATIDKYLRAHNDQDHPVPFEDILSGGCIYSEVSKNKNLADWLKFPVYFKGYIVGYIYGTLMSDSHFTAENAQPSNIILAPSPYTIDPDSCIPVSLAKGNQTQNEVRAAINLKDNPKLLHHEVLVKGLIMKYMGVAGIKYLLRYEVYANE